MSANDRKRASNFSDEEINLLLELMETKWMCIEDKKTDTKTMEKKEAAWNSIMNDYKARISGNRDLDNIKNLWKRLKQAARRKMRPRNEIRGRQVEGHQAVDSYHQNQKECYLCFQLSKLNPL